MKNFDYLDSVRGLACLMVVFSHLTLAFFPGVHNFAKLENLLDFPVQNFLNQSPFGVIWSGSAAVFIFFVLSGFVLAHSFSRKENISLFRLFTARYFRLMIPALASVLIAYLLMSNVTLNLSSKDNLPSWLEDLIVIDPNFRSAIFSGSVSAFLNSENFYNPVLWTMGVELWGSYLVYVFCYFQARMKTYICTIVAACTLTFIYTLEAELALGLSCFMIGLVFYQLKLVISSYIVAIGVLLSGIYLAGIHNDSPSYPFAPPIFGQAAYYYLNILSAPLIVLGVLSLGQAQRLLRHPHLIELGKRSFAIYLIHLPIFYIVTSCINTYLGFATQYEAKAILTSAICVVLSVKLSKVMLKVDHLAIKVSKHLNSP